MLRRNCPLRDVISTNYGGGEAQVLEEENSSCCVWFKTAKMPIIAFIDSESWGKRL